MGFSSVQLRPRAFATLNGRKSTSMSTRSARAMQTTAALADILLLCAT